MQRTSPQPPPIETPGTHRRVAPLCLMILLMFGGLAGFAYDIDIDMTAADINTQGTRGEREVRVSHHPVQRSQRRFARVWRERQTHKRHYREESHVRLASLPRRIRRFQGSSGTLIASLPPGSGTHPTSGKSGTGKSGSGKSGTGKSGTGKPGGGHAGQGGATGGATHEPAPVIVEVPQQNLTLAFVNPKHEPVSGLKLMARVQPQGGVATTINDLTTDDKGHVTLEKIDLPAAVDLDISGQNAAFSNGKDGAAPGDVNGDVKTGTETQADATDDDTVQLSKTGDKVPVGEWDFANVESASLLLDEPRGKPRVASLETAPRLAQSPSQPVRLASLTIPAGAGQRLAAAPNEVRKVVVYDDEQAPIVIERNVVDLDVVAPSGSQITTAALPGQTVQVPASGHAPVRLSLAALEDGAVPLRVAAELPGGQSEAVIESYERDPYSVNTATTPAMQLVRLSNVKLAQNVQVMAPRDAIAKTLGDPSDKKKRGSTVVRPLPDGSAWWIYPAAGVGLKMRPAPFAADDSKDSEKSAALVERVRVFNQSGGSLGGIATGSSLDDVRRNFGAPQMENAPRTPSDALSPAGQIDSYLDGGLRVCHAGGKVLWMDVTRPDNLLATGTTAFVPRQPARLFLAGFQGHPSTNLTGMADFQRYLQQVHSVNIVNSRDAADLVLDARVADFNQDKSDLTDLIPYSYKCKTTLVYSLSDPTENRDIVRDKTATGTAQVSYKGELYKAIGAGILLGKFGGKIGKVGAGAIAIGTLVDLHHKMQRAANRCPGLSARSAFNVLVSDLNRAADFSVRVTAIDYARGLLQLNGGTDDGIYASQPGNPFEFQVAVNGKPLPSGPEDGKSADYYTAVVRSVAAHSSVAELMHVHGKAKNATADFETDPAPEMAQRIPDPATGLIAARAWVQFPPIPVITDEDVQRSLQAESAAGQNAQQSGNTGDNTNGVNSSGGNSSNNPLGGVFNKIFKHKKSG